MIKLILFVLLLSFVASSIRIVPASQQGTVVGTDQKNYFIQKAEVFLQKPLSADILKDIQKRGSFTYVMSSFIDGNYTVCLYANEEYQLALAPMWMVQNKVVSIKGAGPVTTIKGWFSS
jgi:hypothetical protein